VGRQIVHDAAAARPQLGDERSLNIGEKGLAAHRLSSTMDAAIPSWCRAAVKVVVFQWP
jgi:hypothetical protein